MEWLASAMPVRVNPAYAIMALGGLLTNVVCGVIPWGIGMAVIIQRGWAWYMRRRPTA